MSFYCKYCEKSFNEDMGAAMAHQAICDKNPEAESPPELETISAAELMKKNFGEREWVINRIIPKGSVGFLSGKRGSNKTWLSLDLAQAISNGGLFLEKFQATKAHVVYIDSENGEFTMHERLELMNNGAATSTDFFFCFYPNLRLDEEEGCTMFETYLAQWPGSVVFVDAFRRVISIDENDATEVNNVLRVLKQFAEKYNITFILLHHLRKGMAGKNVEDHLDEMRGSSDIANYADFVINLETTKDANVLILRHTKSRVGILLEPARVEIDSDEDCFKMKYVGTWEDVENQPEKAAKAILKWAFESNMSVFKTTAVTEALQELHFTRKAVGRGLKFLVENGQLSKPKKGEFLVPKNTLFNTISVNQNDGTMGQTGQNDLSHASQALNKENGTDGTKNDLGGKRMGQMGQGIIEPCPLSHHSVQAKPAKFSARILNEILGYFSGQILEVTQAQFDGLLAAGAKLEVLNPGSSSGPGPGGGQP